MGTMKFLLVLCLASYVIADERDDSHSHCYFDIQLLLDSSGSIKRENFAQVKTFAKGFTEEVNKHSEVGSNVRIGVIQYSNVINVAVPLSDSASVKQINDSVDALAFLDSETAMVAAIKKAKQEFADSPRMDGTIATKVVVLFTDGIPSYSQNPQEERLENALDLLEDMMDQEIYVIAVGIHQVNDTFLDMIRDYVNEHGENYGFADKANNFTVLGSTDYPKNVIQPLQIDCAPPLDFIDNCPQDIFMLVDSSGSIGRDKFELVKTFAEHLVEEINDKYPIAADGTRIALTSFSRRSNTLLTLDQGVSEENVTNKINRELKFSDSWTHLVEYTQNSIAYLRENHRSNAVMRLLLISDGFPTSENQDTLETIENFINEIEKAVNSDPPIYVTFLGFTGANGHKDQEVIAREIASLSQLNNVNVTNLDKVGFNVQTAFTVVRNMSHTCPAMDLVDICQTDLVIVIDDTSERAFDDSKEIAERITETLEPYVRADRATVTVVSSTQTLMGANVEDLRYTATGNNRLLQALNRAGIVFQQRFDDVKFYRVVLVIHGGMLNSDEASNDAKNNPNSFKDMVYWQLKHRFNAHVHSMPLNASDHGMEVMFRLHTSAGEMLNTDVDYISHLAEACQPANIFLPCEAVDVILLIDVSWTMTPYLRQIAQNVNDTLNFLQAEFGEMTNVALVTFSEYATIHLDLENGELSNQGARSYMNYVLGNLEPTFQSMTNIAEGLMTATNMVFGNHGDRDQGTNHIIIFSDGQANKDTYMNTAALRTANDLTQNSTLLFHSGGASNPPYMDVGFSMLTPWVNATSLPNVLRTEIFTKRNCPPLDIQPDCPNHLIVLIDASGSVDDAGRVTSYEAVKRFATAVVTKYIANSPTEPNIVVIQYSAFPRKEDFESPDDILELSMNGFGGLTNLNSALDLADRTRAENWSGRTSVLLLTDGEWNRGGSPTTKMKNMAEQDFDFSAVLITDQYKMKQEYIKAGLEDPEGDHLFVEKYNDLNTADNVKAATDLICS